MTSRSAVRIDVRRVAAPLATLFVWLACVDARAQTADPVELTWHALAGCPTVEDVQARIRKLAGSSQTHDAPLRAEATITRDATGRLHLQLLVRTEGSVGERHIEGRSCEDLAGAAAVNLVLLLRDAAPLTAAELTQPDGSSGAGEPAQPSASSADTTDEASGTRAAATTSLEPNSAPQPAPTARETEPASRSWRGLLQLPLAAMEIGLLSRPSLGLALAGGVQLEQWRILLDASAWLRQMLPSPQHAELGAKLDRIDLGARVCRTFLVSDVELAPCVNVTLLHVWARGTGPHIAAHTAQVTWIAAGIGAQARLELVRGVSLVAGVDAQLETSRPRIAIDGLGPVGQLGAAAVRIRVGGEWIL